MFRRFLPSRLSPDQEATLVEHLTELRQRLIICVLAIVPAFAVAYAFHSQLISRLIDLLPEDHSTLVTLGVTEPFTTSLKVSFYAALALVLPIILWQIWSFLAPAVGGDIQRILGVFVVLATGLFATGVVFSYAIVLPRALEFLVDYDTELYSEQIRASYFLSFVTLTLFASGLAFEMPIFILALVRLGVLTSDKLRRNRRVGIALMVVFAVLLPRSTRSRSSSRSCRSSCCSSSRSGCRCSSNGAWSEGTNSRYSTRREGRLRRLGSSG